MKKLFLLPLLLLSALSLSAQNYRHVGAIQVQPIQFNMDTMRTLAEGDEAYLTQLLALQKQLQDEYKALQEEQKSLKGERQLYDAQMKLLKERKAQIKSERSFLDDEIAQYNKYLKNISKQHETIRKSNLRDCPAMQEHLALLTSLQRWAETAKADAERRRNRLSEEADRQVQRGYDALGEFLIELQDKEMRLTNMLTQNATNRSMLKEQIKNIKALIKAKK